MALKIKLKREQGNAQGGGYVHYVGRDGDEIVFHLWVRKGDPMPTTADVHFEFMDDEEEVNGETTAKYRFA